jgi:uncharacterized protein involved in exopolysaccharide biosynthesis
MTQASISPQTSGSLLWYYNLVKRHRRLILVATLVPAVLGGILSFLRPREYTAMVRFRPVAGTSGGQGSIAQLGAQLGIALPTANADAPEFYMALLRSRDFLRELGTKRYRLAGSAQPTTLYPFFKINDTTSDAAHLKLVRALGRVTSLSVERTTGIVTVQINTRRPELSEQLATATLELLNAYDLRSRHEHAGAEREFVEQRLTQERDRMSSEEAALASFYDRNKQLLAGRATSAQLTAEESRLQRRVQFQQQLYLSLAQNLARAELEEARTTPTISIIDRAEGFIAPKPRGTVRLALVLALLGFLVGVVLALWREYVQAANGLETEGSSAPPYRANAFTPSPAPDAIPPRQARL